MRLFLDSSVLIAASGRPTGGSAAIVAASVRRRWMLVTSSYVLVEVEKNVHKLDAPASTRWRLVLPALTEVPDVLTLDRLAVVPARKDRPVLFTALSSADALITLDQRDFINVLGDSFYGLSILTPAGFLRRMGFSEV